MDVYDLDELLHWRNGQNKFWLDFQGSMEFHLYSDVSLLLSKVLFSQNFFLENDKIQLFRDQLQNFYDNQQHSNKPLSKLLQSL